MNEAEQTPQQDAIDIRQLARAIRFALVSIVLGLSYLCLSCSLSIDSFESIFHGIANNPHLPILTQFVISARLLFVAVNILVSVAAIVTLFLRGFVTSFYIIGVLGFVIIAQFITLYYAVIAPFNMIIGAMSGMT